MNSKPKSSEFKISPLKKMAQAGRTSAKSSMKYVEDQLKKTKIYSQK